MIKDPAECKARMLRLLRSRCTVWEERDVQPTKPWPFSPKPPWTISCCGTLHVDTGSPEHSSPCMNSSGAYFTLCPSLCLYHSAFLLLKLCHHRRRQRAWQFSLSLISRHRLSVAWLILVSPFKLGFSLKQGAVGSYQCGPFSYT